MRIRAWRIVVMTVALPLVAAGTAVMANNDVARSSAGQTQVRSLPNAAPTDLAAADRAKVNVAQDGKVQDSFHFINVIATLTSQGAPVSDVTVTFTTDSSLPGAGVICTDTTNSHGIATCPNNTKVTTDQFTGTPTQFIATFDGSSTMSPATATGLLTTVG